MAANPDVTIEFIDAPSSEYNNKVTVMLAGGDSEPDVIFVKDTENQVSMKEKGQILNLDEYIKKDAIDLGMYQGVAEQLQMDGSNYTLMSEDYSFMKPAYEQAVRMQDEGIMQSYANLKTGSIHYISVFEQQQCAMLPMGSWFIGTLIQDKEAGKSDFNWGVTTIPHPEGVEAGATVGSTTPVAINAKSDDPDLAWEFVKFATGEEGAMALADNGIFPAASTDAINEKLAAIPGFPEDGTDALNITSWVLDRPIDAKMAAVRKVLEEEHDLIMIGEEDIDTGIANMNQRAKEARED